MSPTPYYEDDLVTLYHGDCLEIVAWQHADLLLCDPPYGRQWRQGDTGTKRGWRSDSHTGIEGDTDTAARDAALRLWGGKPAIVFGDLLTLPPVGAKIALVYDKGGDAGFTGAIGGYRRNVEGIYLVGPGWSSSLGGRSSILSTKVSAGGNLARTTGHPHTKPLDVLGTLLAHSLKGTIADPFAGSGSTLIAARNAGRRAIGVEIDERYCELAARRLSHQVFDFGDWEDAS